MELRNYQQEAVNSIFEYWYNGGGNPLVDMATGTGKSVVIATLVQDLVQKYNARIIMLVHVKELVEQNSRALLRLWSQAPIGINSAGLGRRDKRSQVLFASIQSIAREDHHSLGKADVIIIDEAHLRPSSGDGQYVSFIDKMRQGNRDLRIVGFTATAYRLDSGLLHGKDAPFDDIVYSYGIGCGVDDGYLSPLISRAGSTEIDVTGVAKRGGEFTPASLQNAANKLDAIAEICTDMVSRLTERKSWLVFCTGVDHAHAVAHQLVALGIHAACVTGETPSGERDRLLRDFKAGRIRCLTNANVLTTGFDAPCVDAIALLRPTLSTGLYVQMLGRGTRLFDGKTNCLVLDYAGNVRRHGPVDAIEIKDKSAKKGETNPNDIRAKECPSCAALVGLATITCVNCGHVWERETAEIGTKPDLQAVVMTKELNDVWMAVSKIQVFKHEKPDGLPSLRVEYLCGLHVYTEWVTLEHSGYAHEKARLWWKSISSLAPPETIEDALSAFVEPTRTWIQVARDGQYWRVKARRFERGNRVYELDAKHHLKIVEEELAA